MSYDKYQKSPERLYWQGFEVIIGNLPKTPSVLLQFFLNHRCFMRSELPERVNKSPKELMTGESYPHWLELLGFQRFQKT